MVKLFFAILICPLFVFAQRDVPRFENDTLYTSSGYKIYNGLTLQFGKGTGKNETFRHIVFRIGANDKLLKNASIVVRELKKFQVASYANGFSLSEMALYGNFCIEVTGTIIYKDGSTSYVDLHIAFDKAIEKASELPSELIVPDEYRKNEFSNASELIKKRFILFKNGALTKAEFEEQKKKILTMPVPDNLLSAGQHTVSRFENDTLYTSCGYKMYKGQTLQFGEGTGKNGKFRFINVKNGISKFSLTNSSIVVEKLRNYGISSLGNGYILISSVLNYKDGSRGHLDLHMAFDNAIENSPELKSELIVPADYRNKREVRAAKEINSLDQLCRAGALTREEFETQKNRLLGIL